MAGITINGPSGIDTASLIDQLVALEQQKVTKVQNEQSGYQKQIDAYSKAKTYLSDLKTQAFNLNDPSSFALFTDTSSDESIVTATTSSGASEGNYDVSVFQLARSEKMISADGLVSDQTQKLSTLLPTMTTGNIIINGTKILIANNDTIQDVRMKINNAKDGSGNKLGVSASVLKISDANFRLVLTATNTGAAGITYEDDSSTGANVLQTLGIIQAPSGDNKGNLNQALLSASDIQGSIANGTSIQYSGTDRNGNAVSSQWVKTASNSVNDFLKQVADSYHDMVNVTFDGTGKLSITDKVSGTSQLSMTSLSVNNGPAIAVTATQIGSQGAGVLSVGRDAYYSLDGLGMSSTSNTVKDALAGVSLQLNKASVTDSATLTIAHDYDAVQKKVQSLLDSYNALLKYSQDETAYADPNNSNSVKGDLAGDMTMTSIMNSVRLIFGNNFSSVNGTYNSFPSIGIQSNATTGQLSIDSTKFQAAIKDNFNEVTQMFTTVGKSSSSTIVLGHSTTDTQNGQYTLSQPDALHMKITDSKGVDYLSNVRTGDVVTFSSGPVKGLSLTAPSGSLGIGDGSSASFTFSKGISTLMNDLITGLNDPTSGLVQLRETTLNNQITDDNNRIDKLNRSISDYRARLTAQFSQMEQALQKMKSQFAQMQSALGLNTTTSSS
ncbi:MAG: flagellar filament capping protein FliD [Chitinivibrionales bacterium]|nr:flagellar filament capping protein FliD [Chitinivibrionales bacterium]